MHIVHTVRTQFRFPLVRQHINIYTQIKPYTTHWEIVSEEKESKKKVNIIFASFINHFLGCAFVQLFKVTVYWGYHHWETTNDVRLMLIGCCRLFPFREFMSIRLRYWCIFPQNHKYEKLFNRQIRATKTKKTRSCLKINIPQWEILIVIHF